MNTIEQPEMSPTEILERLRELPPATDELDKENRRTMQAMCIGELVNGDEVKAVKGN